MRFLEIADAAPLRARECAGLVAEQLALRKLRVDRAAVDRDERARAAADMVDMARDQFLAGARLAEDQRGHGAGPDLLDEAQYGTRRGIGEHERLRAHRQGAMLAFRQRNERKGICAVIHGPGAGGTVDDTGIRPRV
ncbi:hypothetical protein WM04_25535 [Burkholderia ubonensis]|nr:hypothetical protein WK68_26995 [Burkholderia ubonensis]KWI25774.1 hypothetical protein WM04_25535 [Burkholderia ubonensis]OJB15271.1 hypothetical protein BGV53_21870 [Burkholderia ubonensis]